MRLVIAWFALACGCADVEVGTIQWVEPKICGLDPESAADAAEYAGQAEVNTLIVHVMRRPRPSVSCGDCIARGDCQPVVAECRCGPSTANIEDAVAALGDVVFEDLDLDDTYCVRVAQLDLDINEDVPAWGPECDPLFECARFLYDMLVLARNRLRVCSVSEAVRFPGSVDIADHRCRGENASGVFNCAELE